MNKPVVENTPIFATPEDVEQAFYEALAHHDLDAMMALWAEDEEIVCIHPDGPRLAGTAAIRESWRQLFSNKLKLHIRTSHIVKTHAMLMATHCAMVYISVEGDDRIPEPIFTTHVFLRGAQGWHIVVHHASHAPDDNKLLMQDTPQVVH